MGICDQITQKEAAVILNRIQSTISRTIKDGRVEYDESKRRLIFRPMLEQCFAQKRRPEIDAPQRKTQMKPVPQRLEAQPVSTDYWQRLADKIEFALGAGPSYWQQRTDPQRLRLFVRTLDELRMQVEMEGVEP